MRTTVALVLCLCLESALPLHSQAEPSERLRVAIAGHINLNRTPNFFQVMHAPQVQGLILDLSKGPIPVEEATTLLAGCGIQVSALADLGLVRREGNKIYQSFALFSASDLSLTLSVSNRYADSLAQAVLAQRKAIEAITAAYDAAYVSREELTFILMGCVSLDWGGLALTASRGDRAATGHHPDGDYDPLVEEQCQVSKRAIFWGSRTHEFNGLRLTTFGDDVCRRLDPPDAFAESFLKIMVTLRVKPQTINELSMASGVSKAEVSSLLPLLSAYGWVAEHEHKFWITVPVLTKLDQKMVEDIQTLGRRIMEAWLNANYLGLKSDLVNLSFVRQGVPFEKGFSTIWHYVFGLANQKLAASGLFVNPYAPVRRFPGFVPVIYDWPISHD